MKKTVIIPNPDKDLGLSVTAAVVKKLKALDITPCIDERYTVCGATTYRNFPGDADLVVVVGGDGSVIDASRYAIDLGIPLVGVNLGKVGYLSEIDPNGIDVLDAIISGEYYVTDKMLLTLESGGVSDTVYAVNDVVISHRDCIGISSFELWDSVGNSLG